jgi:predicted HicB family RNase H-like nuclease
MPTPTLTLRLHPDTRAALEHQAAEVGLPLRTHIAQTLNTAAGVVVAA